MPDKIHPCEAALGSLPGDLLAAISGGVDSMALLHALVATGRKPIVLHFDHGWRKESAADAKWVRDQARLLGLKFVSARLRADGKKREASARAARYAFFSKMAEKFGIADIVLAHHADDQVETFLLQLLRGAGSSGHGMEATSRRDGMLLRRPWLGIWKKEIKAYARKHHVVSREDVTNADIRHRRNLIRRRLLPYLRRHFGPAVSTNLWRAAEIARAENEWMNLLCCEAASDSRLSLEHLRDISVAQQRRTILRWLQQMSVKDVSFADVEGVRGLVHDREPARVNLSRGVSARRRKGLIFLADVPVP